MAKWHNSEGYYDGTAGKAISNMERKEKDIEKKRSEKVRQKCIRMRSMSNEQLYNYVENRVAKARSEGFNEGRKYAVKDMNTLKQKIMSVKGIGEVKAKEIIEAIYG